ncbi:Ig-like domain-containing protein [Spirosoma oryzicola]|uniref:Ig-like domain-containing protein n=1 Tax=Spirosoma oryzicola TaxID=2898794 RepID=UPI001E2DF3F3|nr:Ig-like domain-containing protein [Spirosoma oryzicola]UHG92665.1 Ig-like domain-containing protein [Spirosoma oryzicola]
MKICTFLIFGLLLSSLLAVAQSPTPLAANGQLKVVGTQLTNEAGKAIQLRGVSTHGLQWFPQCYTQSSVQAVAKDWGADVLRIAMYVDEGGYLSGKEAMRTKVNQIVDWAEQSGIYCIIDWHILNPGDPNVHTADAIEFFTIMSQRNAGKKHVIYEICNEPNGVSWSQIKSYAEQVIPAIRKNAPNAVVLVGTPNWDQRPQDVIGNELSYPNLLYTVHFYAASHFFQNDVRSITNKLPVFFSEWGTSTYSGGGSLDFNNGQAWLDLMAGNNPGNQKISWCNWTYSDAGESSAALNSGACNGQQWNNTSPSGTWVKDRILNPADDFGPATPSVAITSPANNTTVTIGSNLVVNASVYNASATAVEFYNGTMLLGSDATAPYSWTIVSVPQGTYSLTAKALISNGNLTSSVVQVTAAPAPNQVPIVSLTSPTNNTAFPLPATISIAANATDNDGSVSKVEFYNGSTKLGEDATAPYTFTWTGMTAGTYTLTAKATDNQGAVTTSGAVTVLVYNQGDSDPTADLIGPNCVYPNTVQLFEVNANKLTNATTFSWWCTGSTKSITTAQAGKASIDFGPSFTGGQVCVGINYSAAPWYSQYCKTVTVCPGTPTNQLPSVSLTSPTNGTTYTAPASITLTATASDTDGTVAKVEFYNGSTKLGESTSAPYRFTWTSVGAGNYALTAKATDNAGATTTSGTINIQVSNPTPTNQAPVVSLTSPANSATFTAPANVVLTASASDADGSITKVEFYNGTTKLGESSSAPYQFTWNAVGAGTYSVTAKATDNAGAVATSAAITISVKAPANQSPTVTLTTPANSATFTAPATVALSANASDADGTITKVEFYNGSTKLGETTSAPYQFAWNNVSAGTYTLTAKATDNLGATTTSASVTIQVNNATTPSPEADLIGADCARPNDVKVYEVNARNLPNATQFSWWFTGSSQSITATQAGKATYNFGPWFSGGQVCVGVNYSAAPWYKSFCKTITVCPAGARVGADEVADNPVFPNPAHDYFTFVAERDIHSMNVVDQTGHEHLQLGSAKAGQTITFGEKLSPGVYLLRIRYEKQAERTLKLLKAGN